MCVSIRQTAPASLRPSATRKRRPAASAILPAALLAVSMLLAAASVLLAAYDLNVYPSADNDEWRFLSRYDRVVRYGDLSDRAMFDAFANYGDHVKIPPTTFTLRLGLHWLLGVGAEAARYISVAQLTLLAALGGLIARRYGAPPALAMLGLPFLLLLPSNFFLARTLRFEQDIIFFAALAVALAILRPRRCWLQAACMAVSGVCTGMAATMHPLGVAFGVGVVAYAGIRAATHRRDCPVRLNVPAGAAWIAGAAVPVVFTAAYFLSDLSNTVRYFRAHAAYDALHQAQKVASLRDLYPSLIPGLPDPIVVAVNAAHASLFMLPPGWQPAMTGPVIAAAWAISAVVVCAGGIWTLARGRIGRPSPAVRAEHDHLRASVGAGAACAFVVTGLRPAAEYFVYFWCLVGLALFLTVALTRRWPLALRWLVLVAFITVEGATVGPVVLRNTQPEGAAAAVQIRAMERLAALVGLEPRDDDAPPVYADTVSWAGAGKRLTPIYEYLIAEVVPLRRDHDGVVFSRAWYDSFVPQIAPFTGQATDVQRRTALMDDLLAGTTFAGFLDVEGVGARFWFLKQAGPAPIFMRVDRSGRQEAWRGLLRQDTHIAVEAGQSHPSVPLRDLKPGRYFALLDGRVLSLSYVQLLVGRQPAVRGPITGAFPFEAGGGFLWFDVTAPANESLAIESHATEPGDIRLRIWRLTDEV